MNKWLLFALGAVLIIVGSFYFWQRNQSAGEQVSPNMEVVEKVQTEAEASSTNPTSEWSVYQDTTLGFSFEYPSAWRASNPWKANDSDYAAGVCVTGSPGDCAGIVNVIRNGNLAEEIEAARADWAINGPVQETTILVAGQNATLLVPTWKTDGYDRKVFFERNGYVFEVYMVADRTPVFDHILATFIFAR